MSAARLGWVWGLGGLIACAAGDKAATGGGPDTGAASSDGEDGTGGGDGGDGGEGTGEDGASAPVELHGRLRLPTGASALPALRVSLVHAAFDGSGPPDLGLGIDTVSADGDRFELTLPLRPPESQIVELAREWPGVRGTVYLPIAYEAADGDPEATWRDGHLVRGGGLDQLVVWLDPEGGELPAGWPTGWVVVDSGMAGMHEPNRCLFNTSEPLLWREHAGYPVFSSVEDGLDLLLRGLPTTLELAGSAADRPSGLDRLAGIPNQVATGLETELGPVFDVALEDAFSVLLEAAPPEEHDVTTDPDWRYTQALALLYADVDGSGDWSLAGDAGGTTGYTLCADREPVLLRYTREPTSWKGYRFLDCYGGTAGWRGIVFDATIGNYAYVDDDVASALATGPGCSF